MAASKKLSNTVKALIFLEKNTPTAKRSTEIAEMIGCNASKIRQLLSMLVKNGIVESTQGKLGGFKLKKHPSDIHLQEIYCAIEDQKAFPIEAQKSKNDSRSIDTYFSGLFSDIQIEIETKMTTITLESIISNVGN